MQLTQHHKDQQYSIQSFSAEGIRANGEEFTESLLIGYDTLPQAWSVRRFADFDATAAEALLECKPEVILIGCGHTQNFPHNEVYARVQREGVGLEVMTTDAACRTYNVLLSEQRRVVAGLLI